MAGLFFPRDDAVAGPGEARAGDVALGECAYCNSSTGGVPAMCALCGLTFHARCGALAAKKLNVNLSTTTPPELPPTFRRVLCDLCRKWGKW